MTRTGGPADAHDPRQEAAYSLTEAARYLRLPPATLRSWALGRRFPTRGGVGRFERLLKLPATRPPMLSFWNLVEAHVVRALRTEHAVSVRALRKALDYAGKELGIDRLLLHQDLRTAKAGRLFLERYGQLIDLSASGQLAMRKVFEEHLKRIEWDERQFPVRLYPFLSSASIGERVIAIDPAIAFGRPAVSRTGVSTRAIADRIDAGEAAEDLADDYGLSTSEIEQAVVYERAA